MFKTLTRYYSEDDGLHVPSAPVVVEPVVDPVREHLEKVSSSLSELHEKIAHLSGKVDAMAQTAPAPVAEPAVPTAEEIADEIVDASEAAGDVGSETSDDAVEMVFDKPRDVHPKEGPKRKKKGLRRR